MIIWGSKIGEETGKELYSGTKDQCVIWCRNEAPAKYESLNICEDTGEIVLRVFKDGKPAADYMKIFEDTEEDMLKKYSKMVDDFAWYKKGDIIKIMMMAKKLNRSYGQDIAERRAAMLDSKD